MEKKPRKSVVEVVPAERVEIFSDIVSQMGRILVRHPEIKNPFTPHIEDSIEAKTWPIPESDYFITRDLKMNSLEVVIGKARVDEFGGESREEVRIRVGRAGVSLNEPSFEYYRKVHNQRRRSLRPDTVGTISAVEKFLREMEQALNP